MMPVNIKLAIFCLLLILGAVLAKEENQQSSQDAVASIAYKHYGNKTENSNDDKELANGNGSENGNGNDNGNGNSANGNKTRPADIIKSQYDGILLAANEQTTCAVVFANEAYGYTAATCVIDTNTNQAIDISQLGVAFYGPSTSTVFAVSKVTVHPNFDISTLANNVAVIEVQQGSMTKRKNKEETQSMAMTPISDSISNWDGLYYIRRTLASVTKCSWAPVQVKSGPIDSSDDVCKVGSPIYAANADAIICSDAAAPALQSTNESCNLPLGMVYGSKQATEVAPLAVYSHTAVFGSDICSANSKRHYYTLLGNYLAWGASAAGQTQSGLNQPTGNSTNVEPGSNASDMGNGSDAEVSKGDPNGSDEVIAKAGNAEYVMAPPGQDSEKINTYFGNLYTLVSSGQPPAGDPNATPISPTTTITIHVTSTITVVGGQDPGQQQPTEGGGSPNPTQGGNEGNASPTPSNSDPMDSMGGDNGAGSPPAGSSPTGNSDTGGSSSSDIPNIITVDTVDIDSINAASSAGNSGGEGSSNGSGNNSSENNKSDSDSDNSGDIDSDSDNNSDIDGDGDGDSDADSDNKSDGDVTPDDTAQNNDNSKTSSMPTGAKIAIVVVILLTVIGIGGGAYWYFKKYKPRHANLTRDHGE